MYTLLTAWNNRSTAFKLSLICCLSTVGLLVPSGFYLSQLNESLTVNRTEVRSLPALHSGDSRVHASANHARADLAAARPRGARSQCL